MSWGDGNCGSSKELGVVSSTPMVAYNGLQNFSSREANALFWSLSVLHTYDIHVHSQARTLVHMKEKQIHHKEVALEKSLDFEVTAEIFRGRVAEARRIDFPSFEMASLCSPSWP